MGGRRSVADLITHGCVALLVKAGTGGPQVATFVAGTLLPDLLSRAPSIALTRLRGLGLPVHEALIYGWTPTHTN